MVGYSEVKPELAVENGVRRDENASNLQRYLTSPNGT
jgi:hypothetical protein